MQNALLEIEFQFKDDTAEKRNRVLKRIEEMDGDSLQWVYNTIFYDELIESASKLPKPRVKLTNKQIVAAIQKGRKENGFYK